jgi:hypothetical protein
MKEGGNFGDFKEISEISVIDNNSDRYIYYPDRQDLRKNPLIRVQIP